MSTIPAPHADCPARRRALVGTGLALGAGLAGSLGATAAHSQVQAQVQTHLLAQAQAQAQPLGASSTGKIWSAEYWAAKGQVKLNLWRKRVGAPEVGEASRPVLFMVHGSSNSTRSSYDLVVPGKGEYSMMDVFARYGYDVWTMDHDGYGRSGSSGNNSDIASGVEDLRAAVPLVMQETGRSKFHFYGTSSGAIRAGAYAQAHADRVDCLVLCAFTYKGTGSPEIGRRAARVDQLRASNRRLRDAAMIRSIFTRDGHAASYDPEVAEAIAHDELRFGDQVPTGTYLDMAANLPLVDPKQLLCPVLMLRGIHDGNSTDDDLLDFYRQLPNGDRQFAILPHTAHSPGYKIGRAHV